MPRTKEPLTAQEVQTGFESLPLEEKVQVFKAMGSVLESEKKKRESDLKLLNSIDHTTHHV